MTKKGIMSTLLGKVPKTTENHNHVAVITKREYCLIQNHGTISKTPMSMKKFQLTANVPIIKEKIDPQTSQDYRDHQ